MQWFFCHWFVLGRFGQWGNWVLSCVGSNTEGFTNKRGTARDHTCKGIRCHWPLHTSLCCPIERKTQSWHCRGWNQDQHQQKGQKWIWQGWFVLVCVILDKLVQIIYGTWRVGIVLYLVPIWCKVFVWCRIRMSENSKWEWCSLRFQVLK